MNIYITLDYELFFGDESGSVDACIIAPTQALLDIVNPLGIKFTCFVDVGYLLQLERQMELFPELLVDYKKVTQQIQLLASQGHGLELHVHPHWEDSYYDGKRWIFDTSRYKLADFSEEEVMDIISRYTKALTRISGIAPVAYRAGGWSAQPFEAIAKGLIANDILIDSTVFPKGYYASTKQCFDFRKVPQYETEYQFSRTPEVMDSKGPFTEIPISSIRVSPLFFWRFAMKKLGKAAKHKAYGDGSAISLSRKEKQRLLTKSSHTVVSIDGYKATLLEKALSKYKKNTEKDGNFVVIGHPKAFTNYSLSKVKQFILKNRLKHTFVTFNT